MDAVTMKIRGDYVVPDIKEIMIGSAADVSKLPTTKKVGTFTDSDANDLLAVGSIAYTADFSLICQLGVDDKWHEV